MDITLLTCEVDDSHEIVSTLFNTYGETYCEGCFQLRLEEEAYVQLGPEMTESEWDALNTSLT